MKKYTSSRLALFFSLLFAFSNAHAVLLFTDINITANSISFTVDGDLTGYLAPSTLVRQQYFTVGYSDSLCTGCTTSFLSNPNTINQSIFSNMDISLTGYTGKWGTEQNGSWSSYGAGSSIAGGITGGPRTIEYSWAGDLFDMLAVDGVLSFYWGTNFNAEGSYYTELASFNYIGNGNFDAPSSAPEPSTLALMGLALIGLLGINRRRVQS